MSLAGLGAGGAQGLGRSIGDVEELLGFLPHVQPHILVVSVARQPGDSPHKIEDGSWGVALFGEQNVDDLRGLGLGESPLAQKGGPVITVTRDNAFPRDLIQLMNGMGDDELSGLGVPIGSAIQIDSETGLSALCASLFGTALPRAAMSCLRP